MPSVLSTGARGVCVVFSSGVCPSVAQFVQVSSDVNSECFQLENNFIICYHRAVISTRPTLITRPGTRERDFLLRKHPPGSTTHSVVLSPKAAAGAIVLEMKSMLRVSSPFLHSICTLSTIFFIFVQVSL